MLAKGVETINKQTQQQTSSHNGLEEQTCTYTCTIHGTLCVQVHVLTHCTQCIWSHMQGCTYM